MTEVLYDASNPGVGVATFDGEEKLNAFDRGTWRGLEAALAQAADDDAIVALVLTGRGRAFAAGADIGEYAGASFDSFVEFQHLVRAVTDRLVSCPKPVIAAVNGYALGGGFELTLACDLVVASTEARFGLPEAKLGLLPGGGGTQRLARAIGRVRAKELIMTGRMLDASESLSWGLVNRVVQPSELMSACIQLSREIASSAPLPVRISKRLIDEGLNLPLDRAIDLEAEMMHPLFRTSDAREGVAAFVEKREPRFVGG